MPERPDEQQRLARMQRRVRELVQDAKRRVTLDPARLGATAAALGRFAGRPDQARSEEARIAVTIYLDSTLEPDGPVDELALARVGYALMEWRGGVMIPSMREARVAVEAYLAAPAAQTTEAPHDGR